MDSLGGGHFDEQILRQIERRDVFILICNPGCFDRCESPDDWVRRELEHAIVLGKRIVPVVLWGFDWPRSEDLPESIRAVTRHNAFEYSHTHWKQTRGRFLQLIGIDHGVALNRRADRGESGPAPVAGSRSDPRSGGVRGAKTDATEERAHRPPSKASTRTEPTMSEQVIGCTVLAIGVGLALWILSLLWRLGSWLVSLF